jgi:anaerobic magnesium-protoporphyrin IX monomethyl ester cyclase
VIKKILLIKAPTTVYQADRTLKSAFSEEVPIPLGLCYLAAVARNAGYEPEIFDPHLDVYDAYRDTRDPDLIKERIRDRLSQGGYDLIGVSSQFIYAYKWGHFLCEAAKEINPSIPVVIGGGHPSVILEETMKDENIDYLVVGEAEVSFLQLLDALNEGPEPDFSKVGGLIYRSEGKITHNRRNDYIWELDEIPFPAYDIIDVNKYMDTYAEGSSERQKTLTMISSRGCPFDCTFCNVYQSWGKKFRKRSTENIMAEIDYLIDQFQVEEICFVDDNMTIDKKRTLEICDGLKSRDVAWRVVNVASFVTNETMLTQMKESGCTKISISVESGSPQVIEDMKKPVDLDWSEDVVNICRRVGLPVTVAFITGMPYETKDDMMKTFEWAGRVRPDWCTFSILVPYPGTEIYEYSLKKGYLHPDSLNLEGLSQRNPTIETENWSREWVSEKTYYYNILLNFLRNYSLTEDDGQLSFVTDFFENVVMHHKQHLIAFVCLGYAHYKAGNAEGERKALAHAETLLDDPTSMATYGEFLEMDEIVINHFQAWRKQSSDIATPRAAEIDGFILGPRIGAR